MRKNIHKKTTGRPLADLVDCCYVCKSMITKPVKCTTCNTVAYCSRECMVNDIPKHSIICTSKTRELTIACDNILRTIITDNTALYSILGALLHWWKVTEYTHIQCLVLQATGESTELNGNMYDVHITYVPGPTTHRKKGLLFAVLCMESDTKTFCLATGMASEDCKTMYSATRIIFPRVDWADAKRNGIKMLISDTGYMAFMYGDMRYVLQ